MDKAINKILQILTLSVIFVSSAVCQTMPFYLKADAPGYIQSNSEFEASLLLRVFDLNADEIVLHILTSDPVNLKGVKLNGVQKQFKLNDSDRFEKSFDVRFNLKDDQINYESFLNIRLSLISGKPESSEIDFKIDYVKDKTIIRTYGSSDFSKDDNPVPKINLDFYKPQAVPGKSLVLKQDSEIKFSFNYRKEISNFLVEFWARFEKPADRFLSFVNGDRKDTVISLDINKNKILSTNEIDEITFVKDCFISKNAWYHIALFINIKKSTADVYVNNDLAITIDISNSISENNFEVLFNKFNEGKIEIDQFKVWEFKNTPRLSIANKNYENYSADSSRIFLNLSFNDENQVRNFNSTNASISFKSISFKNSTAPIFSKAPQLNVYLYNDFYQIEWTNNSRKDADYFELEKSVDGIKFVKIFETFASDDPQKVYYFSDPKDIANEIIYYRYN